MTSVSEINSSIHNALVKLLGIQENNICRIVVDVSYDRLPNVYIWRRVIGRGDGE